MVKEHSNVPDLQHQQQVKVKDYKESLFYVDNSI